MKLSRLPMVLGMIGERRQLVDNLEHLAERRIGLTIDAVRQDETLIALVLPVIACELKARIAKLDRELEALDVEVA